jgi:drug/metabolite transporter (DMT)-like permease
LWILAFIGLTGAAAQFCITEAFRLAPASVVAPFEYTALLWGISLDWALWQVLPDAVVLVGGAIVIASGLYIIWDERRAATRNPVVSG